MATSSSEMEAPAMEKWPMAICRGERERERERERMRKKKKKGAHVLTFGIKIIDRFFVNKKLMKQIISLIHYYRQIFRQ